MKSQNKKMLVLSIVSIAVCFAMLLGTTFAWFTDSVSSNNNLIQAGILDVELQYYKDGNWADVTGKSDVITNELWEPGATEVAYFRLANAGSLAFKYSLAVNIVSETKALNAMGQEFALSDYIYYDVETIGVSETTPFAPYTKDQATALLTETTLIKEGYYKDTYMLSGEEIYFAMLLHMPQTVGNEANYVGDVAPTIELGINVYATQFTYEDDSFGTDYDKYTAAFSVAEAQEMFANNKDFTLVNANEPTNTLTIPANYTGNVTLMNVNLAGIAVEDGATQWLTATGEQNAIEVVGNVAVVATEEGKSAITGKNINIYGDGTLTAVGKGAHAFGIGGTATQSINIKDVTIAYVAGGSAYGVGTDTKYYKDAPEGGAAIGSGLNGATISLDNVTVKAAIGGSKSAAIGAMYHTGVQVSIANSTIEYAEGGVTAAAIGSSRVSNGATEAATTINITNSTVKAVGGVYGAGIGSGYDTHCQSVQPLCTINIADSTITAHGGKYAAGVGTGYHTAALAGDITNSTVDATAGEIYYKDSYTIATAVGFGVVDPAREGAQTDSYINYNGKKIVIGDGACLTSSATYADFQQMLEGGKTVYFTESVNLTDPSTTDYRTFLTLTGETTIHLKAGAELKFDEVTGITGDGKLTISGGALKVSKELYTTGDASVTFESGVYSLGAFSIVDHSSVTINGGTFYCYGTYGANELGICFGEYGSLVVNDGTLNMYTPINLSQNRCDQAYVEINGGTINLVEGQDRLFTVRDIMDKDYTSGWIRGSRIRINGGVFTTTYQLDSDADANAFIRNADTPDTLRVLAGPTYNGKVDYDCVVTGGTFYGCWQRADNNRLGRGEILTNTIAGFVGAGYQMTGDAINGYVVVAL